MSSLAVVTGGPVWASGGVDPVLAGAGAVLTGDLVVVPGETLTVQVARNGGGRATFPAITQVSMGWAAGPMVVTAVSPAPRHTLAAVRITRIWRGGSAHVAGRHRGGGGVGLSDTLTDTGSPTLMGDAGLSSPGEAGREKDTVARPACRPVVVAPYSLAVPQARAVRLADRYRAAQDPRTRPHH